jgi:hypothetical protein
LVVDCEKGKLFNDRSEELNSVHIAVVFLYKKVDDESEHSYGNDNYLEGDKEKKKLIKSSRI